MPTRARQKVLRGLLRAEGRREAGLFLVEGRRLVEEALRSGAPLTEILHTAAFAGSAPGRDLLAAARAAGVPAEALPERDLARLSDTTTPQGVVGVVRRRVPDPAAAAAEGLLLALDGVADPGNVGTLVRAADAFAARAILAGPGTADFENPKVLRSAMGSTFHVPCLPVPDLAATLAGLRRGGSFVVAATLAGRDAREIRAPGPRVVLVLGNEARGVSPAVLAQADAAATVVCPGRAESLNVAIAGGVLLALFAGSVR
jgi:TrmH family RNA methyltransferase